jgi:hypothetical protein
MSNQMEMLRRVLRASADLTAAARTHSDFDWFVITSPLTCYKADRQKNFKKYTMKPAGEGEYKALCGFKMSGSSNAIVLRYVQSYDDNGDPIYIDFTIPIRKMRIDAPDIPESVIRERMKNGEKVLAWMDSQAALGKGRRPAWMSQGAKTPTSEPKGVPAPEAAKKAEAELPPFVPKRKVQGPTDKWGFSKKPDAAPAKAPAAKPAKPAPKGDSSRGDDDDDFGSLPIRKK